MSDVWNQTYSDCPYYEDVCKLKQCYCPKYKAYKDVQNPEIVAQVLKENNFDTSLEPWDLLIAMQTSFASRIRDLDVLTKHDIDVWIDRFLVCIDDEVSEIREYLDIYSNHYLNKKHTLNFKKEVIDVLHFVLELFITLHVPKEKIREVYGKLYGDLGDGDIIECAYHKQTKMIDKYLYTENDASQDVTILKASCKILDACSQVRKYISWKHWKQPSETIEYDKLYESFVTVLFEFINLCVLTMRVDEIKDIYIQKNVENILRQKYGY